MYYPKTLDNRLDKIKNTIYNSAKKAGRNPNNINIVAVTKSFPVETWQQAIDVDLNILGESRVQETKNKLTQFAQKTKIELHLIGHLQSNKASTAIKLFNVIQTVDSIKLAQKINMNAQKIKKAQKIFIQININADPKKYGFALKDTLIASQIITKMKNINLSGIMVIPMQNLSVEELKNTYNATRKLRDKIQIKINQNCKNISMGMSNDYAIAAAEGATHIRIGTALFGARKV